MAAFEDQLNVLNAAYENPVDIYCSTKALIDANIGGTVAICCAF